MSQPDRDTLSPLSFRDRHTLIQDRLKDYIVRNHLKAGDMLPTEGALAEQLGVSRTAIREALRGLEALGIVASQHGVGRVVQPFSFAPILENLSYGLVFQDYSILQVTDIRKALDAYFIEQAMGNLTEEDITTLSEIVEQMQERTDAGLDMEREDHRFHDLLYRRCGNPLALQLFEITWQVRLAALDRSRVLREMPPGTVREHRDLLEAIRQRDAELARQIIIDHHWNIEQRFQKAIEWERAQSQSSEAQKGGDERP
jgi:DNA-binding FadR family transcriptional regulator